MTKVISILASVSALAVAAQASAQEPFVLDENEMDAVTAAGVVVFNTNVTKLVDIDKTVDLTVNKTVTSTVDLTGYLATAEASADAIQFENALAETDVFAQVDATGAFSFGEALAAGFGGFTDATPPVVVAP